MLNTIGKLQWVAREHTKGYSGLPGNIPKVTVGCQGTHQRFHYTRVKYNSLAFYRAGTGSRCEWGCTLEGIGWGWGWEWGGEYIVECGGQEPQKLCKLHMTST